MTDPSLLRPVGVWRRFLAILVDGFVAMVWIYPLAEVVRSPGYFSIRLTGGRFIGASIVTIAYAVLMEGAFGATIGKFVTGLRVVGEDGRRIDPGQAMKRNLARVIDFLPWAYLVAAISVWTSPRNQRLGDRWGRTLVVTADSARAAEAAPTPMLAGTPGPVDAPLPPLPPLPPPPP